MIKESISNNVNSNNTFKCNKMKILPKFSWISYREWDRQTTKSNWNDLIFKLYLSTLTMIFKNSDYFFPHKHNICLWVSNAYYIKKCDSSFIYRVIQLQFIPKLLTSFKNCARNCSFVKSVSETGPAFIYK